MIVIDVYKRQGMDSKRRVELISQMIEYRSKESGGKSMLIHVRCV